MKGGVVFVNVAGQWCEMHERMNSSKYQRFPASFLQTLWRRDMLVYIADFCKERFPFSLDKSSLTENHYLAANIL